MFASKTRWKAMKKERRLKGAMASLDPPVLQQCLYIWIINSVFFAAWSEVIVFL